MEKSPLQLESYAFDRIELKAQEDPNPSHHNLITGQVNHGVAHEDSRHWHVTLDLSLKAIKGETPLYLGRIAAEGVFRVHPNWPEDKVEALVSSNAPALLYGAIREMVVNLTGRSKHGPINLNTVRFPPNTKATERASTKKPEDYYRTPISLKSKANEYKLPSIPKPIA